jgi:hypothetical protein
VILPILKSDSPKKNCNLHVDIIFLHVDIIFLHVNIVYLACRGQKYATIDKLLGKSRITGDTNVIQFLQDYLMMMMMMMMMMMKYL